MTCEQVSKSNEAANEHCRSIVSEVMALEELVANGQDYSDDLQGEMRELWIELAESVGEEPSSLTVRPA